LNSLHLLLDFCWIRSTWFTSPAPPSLILLLLLVPWPRPLDLMLVESEGSGAWRPSRHPKRPRPCGGAGRRQIARLRSPSLPRPMPQGPPRGVPDPEGGGVWQGWATLVKDRLGVRLAMGTHGEMLHVEHFH